MTFEVPTDLTSSILDGLTSFFSDPGLMSFVTLIFGFLAFFWIASYFFGFGNQVETDDDDDDE